MTRRMISSSSWEPARVKLVKGNVTALTLKAAIFGKATMFVLIYYNITIFTIFIHLSAKCAMLCPKLFSSSKIISHFLSDLLRYI